MEQRLKRFKITKESCISDIASTIDDVAKTVQLISESYSEILRANKAVVKYLQNGKELIGNIDLEEVEGSSENRSVSKEL